MLHLLKSVTTTAGLALCLVLSGCGDDNDIARFIPSDDNGGETGTPVEPADACKLPDEEVPVMATSSGIEYVRTPDECFADLVNFPFDPHYAEVDGMRMHYTDEGPADGEVVLMLHGQPSWSYLYRKMIPVFAEAGYRAIAADHIGMGRSDKPVDPRVHTYEQQVQWNKDFIDALELDNITLFVQDWGSLIGLRVAGDMPDRVARIVLANGNLPPLTADFNPFRLPVFEFDDALPLDTVEFFANRPSDNFVNSFQAWIDWAAGVPILFAADVVQLGGVVDLSEGELASYNAPFPSEIYRGAIRAFPSMIATFDGSQLPALEALGRYDRPFLSLAGEFDRNLGSQATQNEWINRVPGAEGQPHNRYNAGHFIQDDVGEEMAGDVVDFMEKTPIPEALPLYGRRYCEILLVETIEETLTALVYNSIGLNDCPQEQWDAIDAQAIADEFSADLASKNGPRFWLLDLITPGEGGTGTGVIPGAGEVEMFGGIDMRLAASVEVGGTVDQEATPYVINSVQRNTLYTLVAGRRVYELHDPDGGRYIMQSMSRIIDDELEIWELTRLGERLSLPEGWRYSTRILTETEQYDSGGLAEVVVDDLRNTYQKVE